MKRERVLTLDQDLAIELNQHNPPIWRFMKGLKNLMKLREAEAGSVVGPEG
jgi:hypothetical protein